MRNIQLLIFLTLSGIFYGCTDKEVRFESLVLRDGMYYEINADEPFSGKAFRKYANGQNALLCEFSEGMEDGQWQEWYENGQIKVQGEYVSRVKSGTWEYWYENGQKQTEEQYTNGTLIGTYISWWLDGSIHKELDYSKTPPVKKGTWKIYYTGKGLEVEDIHDAEHYIVITFKDGQPVGEVLGYYVNGSLKLKGTYTSFDPEVKNGEFEYYHSNGQLAAKGSYLNDMMDGQWVNYYENGQKESEGTFQKGVVNGPWKKWNIWGVLVDNRNYLNGKKHGLCQWFNNKGELEGQGEYRNDVLNGHYVKYETVYTGSGNNTVHHKVMEGEFKNGKRNGKFIFYEYNIFTGELLRTREERIYQ